MENILYHPKEFGFNEQKFKKKKSLGVNDQDGIWRNPIWGARVLL